MDKIVQTFTDWKYVFRRQRWNHISQRSSITYPTGRVVANRLKQINNGSHVPSNQVRHAAAGLAAGFALGDLGLWIMNSRENPDDPAAVYDNDPRSQWRQWSPRLWS